MIYSKNEHLKDLVIKILLTKEQSVKSIHKTLLSQQKKFTLQGIYRVLRDLIGDEIIIKRKNIYLVSEEWCDRIINGFKRRQNNITLSEHESIQFNLDSLIHLDQQWKNIIIPLQESFSNFPVFLYNTHEIWIHLSTSRKESEYNYYKSFKKNSYSSYCLFGGNTNFDKEISIDLKHEKLNINYGYKPFPETDYIIIINDYIIITRISRKIANKIKDVYLKNKTIDKLEQNLQKLGIEKKKVKLIIERNHEKAKVFRKKISRDFYIPMQLRKQFDLF